MEIKHLLKGHKGTNMHEKKQNVHMDVSKNRGTGL